MPGCQGEKHYKAGKSVILCMVIHFDVKSNKNIGCNDNSLVGVN